MPRAVIHGADGKDYPASAWQTAAGPQLEFSFDDSSLPPAAYPYVIDPTTTFYSATSDGYIYGQSSTYSHCEKHVLRLRCRPRLPLTLGRLLHLFSHTACTVRTWSLTRHPLVRQAP